ncbi:uncharacterized protein BP01DRAFT_182520 [Aspergillus saccharolyticus JOP 1030-1]|uniref:Uncharacterized protein n=1 Tax=Aspergillus saccharolyticus JOP 1030-1 TaxID=1450539 RepID=A0A318Z1P0_9EURO|nr:hypothetical protein BP01DRAFT_182520 [Aspergillus saccharolyticus JOP 1030-1]PYH41205.1 hypothetical protein BP01DRAFT_182520 [Aspergillus saccharolyticus JOP 1030-1]
MNVGRSIRTRSRRGLSLAPREVRWGEDGEAALLPWRMPHAALASRKGQLAATPPTMRPAAPLHLDTFFFLAIYSAFQTTIHFLNTC